jgi:hypothetical protein
MARPASSAPGGSERRLKAQLAAHTLHARVDSTAHTMAAREGFERRFLDEVDPERVLSEDERVRRAQHARKAYFARLALASVRSRAADRRVAKRSNDECDDRPDTSP